MLKVGFEKIQILYHGSISLKDAELAYDFYLPSKLDMNMLDMTPDDTNTVILLTNNII